MRGRNNLPSGIERSGRLRRDCRVFPLVVRVAVLALEQVARSAVPERVRAVVRLGFFGGLGLRRLFLHGVLIRFHIVKYYGFDNSIAVLIVRRAQQRE